MAIFDVWMGWFLLFLSLHIVISLPSSLCSREDNGLEEDVGWRNPRWLFIARQSANAMIFPESPCSRKPFIKFLLQRTYSLEEDVGWRIPRWLCSAWSSLFVWMGWFSQILTHCLKPLIQFLLKRIYSLEEVGRRIPRWLLRVWLSLRCERDWLAILSLHIGRSLPSSFWTREYMVWKKMLVEEFQDAWIVHGNLWWVNGVNGILAI